MNREYEYSFMVKNLAPYIEYCNKNKYFKESESIQTRILYLNINKTLARITTITENGKTKTLLDFKDEGDCDELLKIARETIPLEITDSNKKAIDSILKILDYKKKKTVIRKRYVFTKKGVIFELDEYSSPKNTYVVAVEGKSKEVDKVYNEIKNLEKIKKVKLS